MHFASHRSTGSSTSRPVPYADRVKHDLAYFKKQAAVLRLLKENFKSVVIRIFSRDALFNGNIVDDFFRFMDIDVSGLERAHVNQSMPEGMLPYLNALYAAQTENFRGNALESSLSRMTHSLFTGNGSDKNVEETARSELLEVIAKTDAILPGYASLFNARPCSPGFPEAEIPPGDELLFTMLFSLCKELDSLARKVNGIAKPQQCDNCGMCRNCPSGIDIRKLLSAYDVYARHGCKPFYFFAAVGVPPASLAVHCEDAACNLCERGCGQRLPIRKRLEELRGLIRKREGMVRKTLADCFEGCEGRRIGIYPSGAFANEMWNELVRITPETGFDVFFFDSNPERAENYPFFKHFKQKIYSPDDIRNLAIDRIIIASDAHYKEIYARLKPLETTGIEFRRLTFGAFYSK